MESEEMETFTFYVLSRYDDHPSLIVWQIE